ncbi:immunoglobulin kappa light chain-like [Trachinotus anak]|uniref:immunoglobulin kappa light chain-like n=1 Tax=Trachinotus anak TaxID=443729 RepID=UPI0039F1C49C
MTPPNFALYFSFLFVSSMAHLTALKQSSLHFQSANVGDSVTLLCLCQDEAAVMFYWYKQTLGQKPKMMSTYYKHNNNGTFDGEYSGNPRFSLDTGNGKNNLKISHLQITDSATYYCVRSNLYVFEFCEGTTVSVKGSGLNIQASVHQSGSETIQPGGSATLSCTVHTGTCDGEHSVYWFKDSEEPHPGLIYTHGDRNDTCERKPEKQTHTCDYNLPMQSLNRSHAETYYCAVASCGHILFGNGTKLDYDYDVSSVVLVYVLSGALAFTTILVIFLTFSVYKMYKRIYCCTDSATSTPNTELCQDAENLHYAALKAPKVNRSRRQRDDAPSECVYSSVRQ